MSEYVQQRISGIGGTAPFYLGLRSLWLPGRSPCRVALWGHTCHPEPTIPLKWPDGTAGGFCHPGSQQTFLDASGSVSLLMEQGVCVPEARGEEAQTLPLDLRDVHTPGKGSTGLVQSDCPLRGPSSCSAGRFCVGCG